jgi:putative transposase
LEFGDLQPCFVSDIVGSTGRRGNPSNNAKAERFMKTLKVEAV